MLPGQEWVAKEFVLFIHERIVQREASKDLPPIPATVPTAHRLHYTIIGEWQQGNKLWPLWKITLFLWHI